jgi:hypothetical protein
VIQVALLLVFAFQSAPQKQSAASDEAAIQALIASLEAHRAAPAELLDPDLERERRQKSLAAFRDKLYQVSFYEKSPLVFADGTHASMDTRVHFRDGHSEATMTTTLNFVRRDGDWYFADYEFLGFPPVLIAVVVVAATVGIGFAVMVLVLRARLRRTGKLDISRQLLVFAPFAWPALWRESQEDNQAAR